MQPYLAANVSTDIGTINILWSFGNFGYILGCLLAGTVYKSWLPTQKVKMTFLGLNIAFTGLTCCLLPFLTSFWQLLACRLVQFICQGLYVTADCITVVYTMGPVISRPFTQALHATIGVGFLLSTLLVQPFLPSLEEHSREAICDLNVTRKEGTDVDLVEGIEWPFLISGLWCC